jgi:hypothetical protein
MRDQTAAGVADGQVFRSVNRADRVGGEGLGEKVVWLVGRDQTGHFTFLTMMKQRRPVRYEAILVTVALDAVPSITTRAG